MTPSYQIFVQTFCLEPKIMIKKNGFGRKFVTKICEKLKRMLGEAGSFGWRGTGGRGHYLQSAPLPQMTPYSVPSLSSPQEFSWALAAEVLRI